MSQNEETKKVQNEETKKMFPIIPLLLHAKKKLLKKKLQKFYAMNFGI